MGKDQSLDKERIIHEFVEFTPITNQRRDEESMSIFLDKVKVNGVQDPGLTPFREFLPRSVPLVDFLSIRLHSGVGWKYPSANTIHGIQAYRGLSHQRLEDVEIKEIIQDLPVCVGLGVKGDVQEIEQFYSKVSSINLEMAGFIDLRALTLVVGYQMNARGITPMGVLVLGAILNKCVRPQTLPGGYLKLDPRINSPGTVAKRCKTIGRPQRDCILKWARLNPEREDPVEPEPEPVHDVKPEKEKDPVAAGSRCKRSTAPGHTRRKPTKK